MFTAESRTREEMCVTDNKQTSITRNGNYYANERCGFFPRNFLDDMCIHFGWARKEHKICTNTRMLLAEPKKSQK